MIEPSATTSGATFLARLRMAALGASLALLLPAAAQGEDAAGRCGDKIAAAGFPRASQQLAEIAAIGNWIEAAARVDPKYAVWHRAEGKAIKCEKIGTIGRISCTVVARPCVAAEADKTAAVTEAK